MAMKFVTKLAVTWLLYKNPEISSRSLCSSCSSCRCRNV